MFPLSKQVNGTSNTDPDVTPRLTKASCDKRSHTAKPAEAGFQAAMKQPYDSDKQQTKKFHQTSRYFAGTRLRERARNPSPDIMHKKTTLLGGLKQTVGAAQQLKQLQTVESFTWHRAIFAGGCPPTIVAAAAFHARVRDGSGWVHSAMDTRIETSSGEP